MGATVNAFCLSCRVQSRMDEVAVVPQWDQEEDSWLVLRCPGCHGRVLMSAESINSWEVRYSQLFPRTERAGAAVPRHLPDRVEKTYRSALTCLEVKESEAAAAMVGRCIEAIGRDRGARETGDSLFVIIDRMVRQGVLTESQGEIAHLLRALRNDGAHDTDFTIAGEDAADAVKLLEMMLVAIYTIQRGYEQLRARREAARAPAVDRPPPAAVASGEDDDIPF